MKKVMVLGSLVSALGLASTGCMVSRDYYEPLEQGEYEYFEDIVGEGFAGNLDVIDGSIRGDVGPVTNVDADATILNGYDDGSFSDVEVIAETDQGAAMSWFEIVGGINHPALRPGFRETFTDGDYGFDSRNLHVRVIHCAGEVYNWSYDRPADEVEISVEEGPTEDTLRVNYTTRTWATDPFTGARSPTPDTVTGSFDVRR